MQASIVALAFITYTTNALTNMSIQAMASACVNNMPAQLESTMSHPSILTATMVTKDVAVIAWWIVDGTQKAANNNRGHDHRLPPPTTVYPIV
jgi:hypothetical protein